MFTALRMPLAIKPKPVEKARFLIKPEPQGKMTTQVRTRSPTAAGSSAAAAGTSASMVSPVTTPDAGSPNKGLFIRLYIEPHPQHPNRIAKKGNPAA